MKLFLCLIFLVIIVTVLLLFKNKSKSDNVYPIKPVKPQISQSNAFQWCYNTGYPWSIPRISLPDGLGLLLQYQMEWWFYVGYLRDDKDNYYSFEFTVIRTGIGSPVFQAVNGGIKVGLYNKNKNVNVPPFKKTESYGFGASKDRGSSLYVPTVTDTVYQVEFKPIIGKDYFNVYCKQGVVGQPGSIYNIVCNGEDYSFNFDMQDLFGGRMEGENGFIGTAGENNNNSSYEYCFPWHTVLGGNINMSGSQTSIKEGWIWLDRQVITYKQGEGPLGDLDKLLLMKNPKVLSSLHNVRSRITEKKEKKDYTLYTGNWIACVLPDTGASFYVAVGWPTVDQKGQQWKVGKDLNIEENWRIGAIWGPPDSLPQGEALDNKFRLNIKNSDDPDNSPHWKSDISGNTYCNAWKLTFDKKHKGLPSKTLYFEYFRPDCETVPAVGSAFMECAARVYDSNMKQVGWGWVEQMGQN